MCVCVCVCEDTSTYLSGRMVFILEMLHCIINSFPTYFTLSPHPPPPPPVSLSQVVDQESAFKAKLGLCGDDYNTNTLSLANTSTPPKMPVTTDTITR